MNLPVAGAAALLAVALTSGCGDGSAGAGDGGDRGTTELPPREPEHFGTATVTADTLPGCDLLLPGADAVLEAGGYNPGAEVVVALQLVGAQADRVATVTADSGGTVAVPVTLPALPAGAVDSLGGFELIGEGPDGLLLNEALVILGDPETCEGD